MKRYSIILFILCALVLISCDEDDNDLPPVDERVSEAISDLVEELTEPANGWRLDYQPTPDAGILYMLLDFDDEGNVAIQSDIAVNDGEFFNQTISYRIDNTSGLELILETYAVFHYLFELDQTTFGAEFEFVFIGKEGNNLLFESKTDRFDKTQLLFTPASPDADASFSREIAENLDQFEGFTPQIFGGAPPIQQTVLEDKNISVFWSIDLAKRLIEFDLAGEGTTIEEIDSNTNNVNINRTSGYTLRDGKLILLSPVTFSVGGEQITINEITLTDFSIDGPALCPSNPENTPVYAGQIAGQGSVTLYKSLFESSGADFQPMEDNPYSINVRLVFDQDANSVAEEGSIFEYFPNATGFVFNYGLDSMGLPANAVGLILDGASEDPKTYLREFEATETVGNRIRINLTDDFYYSQAPEAGQEQQLAEITDEIFEGGEIYASDLPIDGLKVFRLYNPCNRYEFFLVQ